MSLPVGHGAIGVGLLTLLDREYDPLRDHRKTMGAIALANLPDLDYLLLALGFDYHVIHRTFTHSALFALVIGSLIATSFIWSRREECIRCGMIFAALIFSHSLLDLTTTSDEFFFIPGPTLLWPFSDYTFRLHDSPLPFFYHHPASGSFLNVSFSDFVGLCLENSARESLLFLPPLAALILARRRRFESTGCSSGSPAKS